MRSDAATEALLGWYEDRHGRYPWRGSRDPYAVLVSEVMLQQTQAPRVVPHFERFLERFPDVRALAGAPRSEVLRAWDGLGYNRRAVALSEAARAIVRDHDGVVPSDPERLRELPGVGPYTAAAVAALAFGRPIVAVDTNVRRVVARVRGGVEADELERGDLRALATRWLDGADPAAWNQAVMDLGRERCRPRPRCDGCPLARSCRYRRAGSFAATGVTRRARGGERFEGSSRQLRGAIVRALRAASPRTISALSRSTGFELERVHAAVVGLQRDGVVVAGPAATAGSPRGTVRLPD